MIPSTTPVSMQVIILILLVFIVLYLCFTPGIVRGESASREHQHHTHLPDEHRYLSSRDRTGDLPYEEDGCRNCIEARAKQRRRQGVEVTGCVLETKRSSTL